eukprot:3893986-Alexandrium_andersonii.AAC.1
MRDRRARPVERGEQGGFEVATTVHARGRAHHDGSPAWYVSGEAEIGLVASATKAPFHAPPGIG